MEHEDGMDDESRKFFRKIDVRIIRIQKAKDAIKELQKDFSDCGLDGFDEIAEEAKKLLSRIIGETKATAECLKEDYK